MRRALHARSLVNGRILGKPEVILTRQFVRWSSCQRLCIPSDYRNRNYRLSDSIEEGHLEHRTYIRRGWAYAAKRSTPKEITRRSSARESRYCGSVPDCRDPAARAEVCQGRPCRVAAVRLRLGR